MKMMKKVLLVVLCLMLAASVSLAQTSGPSNVAGYVKINCLGYTAGAAASTAFGLPFKFWEVAAGVPQYGVESTSPSDIVGNQSNPGSSTSADAIVRQGGDFAYRDNGTGLWAGGLEDDAGMIPFEAYWYANKSGAARTLVLAGEVDNAGNYGNKLISAPTTSGGAASVSYSFRDSRNVPVELLALVEAGFTGGTTAITSDALVEQGGYQLAYLVPPGEWDFGGEGEPFHYITPGKAYWIVNKHMGHPWNYNYVGLPSLPARMHNGEGVVTSKTVKATDKAKATVGKTTSIKKNTSSKTGTKVRTNK